MKHYIKAIICLIKIWSIHTLWKEYKTAEEWENAGQPLDFKTSWDIAKGIWLES